MNSYSLQTKNTDCEISYQIDQLLDKLMTAEN